MPKTTVRAKAMFWMGPDLHVENEDGSTDIYTNAKVIKHEWKFDKGVICTPVEFTQIKEGIEDVHSTEETS